MIRAGADAIYYSVSPLHPQKQLKMDKLAEEVKVCRLRGVKTRVIMDGSLNDEQILEARDFVDQISQLGVDALTVGDLGLARMARAVAPQLPVYASDRLAVHHLSGVLAARELGFSRVMLAKELSLSDITFILKSAPIETEVFVCGFLCPASCARCALPIMVRRREDEPCSRLCSQPMAFFSEAPERHLLMKALNLAPHLSQLQKAGVRGIVVGGMGDPMAGALATKLMRGCLDTGEAPDAKIMEQLRVFFSTGLYRRLFYRGKRRADARAGNGRSKRAAARTEEAAQTGAAWATSAFGSRGHDLIRFQRRGSGSILPSRRPK